MEKTKHYIGLTDSQVLESREKYGSNVLTPPKEDGFWKQVLEICKHPIAITMFVLMGISIITACILYSSMGTNIFVMPAIVTTATILVLFVGFYGGFEDEWFRILIAVFLFGPAFKPCAGCQTSTKCEYATQCKQNNDNKTYNCHYYNDDGSVSKDTITCDKAK